MENKVFLNNDALWHRINGPAFINIEKKCISNNFNFPSPSLVKGYFLYGKEYSKEKYYKIMFIMKTFCNKLKKRLRNTYTCLLYTTNLCDEKELYSLIASYMI
jgi:hypothetical protein